MEEAETGLPPLLLGFSHDRKLAFWLYGVFSPIIVIFIVINNIIVVTVLYIDPKKRSPSCVQHTCIAVLNCLTGLFQLPVFLKIFASRQEQHPYTLCLFYRVCGYILPHMCQSCVTWVFIALVLQRFMCFKFPFHAIVWYKTKYIIMETVVAIVVPSCTFLVRFFDFKLSPLNISENYDFGNFTTAQDSVYESTSVNIKILNKTEPVLRCLVQSVYGEEHRRNYHVASLLINGFLPLCVLIVFHVLLVQAILTNHFRRKRLARNSHLALRAARRKTMKESSVLVLMSVFVVITIPNFIVKAVNISQYYSTVGPKKLPQDNIDDIGSIIICHFLQLLSYSWYIFVYAVMNHEFRSTARGLWAKILRRHEHEEVEMQAL